MTILYTNDITSCNYLSFDWLFTCSIC